MSGGSHRWRWLLHKDGQRSGVKQITSRNVEDGGVKMEQDAFVEARINK